MTTTDTQAATTFSCTVKAQDFASRTNDSQYESWTEGKLRHLIAALDGRPVALIADRQTGHTAVGVKLIELRYSGADARLVYEWVGNDGKSYRTATLLFKLGDTIIPIVDTTVGGGAKWRALETYRKECTAAVMLCQKLHGEPEGRKWGTWASYCTGRGVMVTYTPHTGHREHEAGTRFWGHVIDGKIVKF